jgi:hypothetical protein
VKSKKRVQSIVEAIEAELKPFKYKKGSVAIFDNEGEMKNWLETCPPAPFYVYSYFKRECEPQYGWVVSLWYRKEIKKNHVIRWGAVERAKKQILESRRKSREITARTQKIPIPGMGRYPNKPRNLKYTTRWEQRELEDEAERRGEIEELTEEELNDPELWKKKRLGVDGK